MAGPRVHRRSLLIFPIHASPAPVISACTSTAAAVSRSITGVDSFCSVLKTTLAIYAHLSKRRVDCSAHKAREMFRIKSNVAKTLPF